MNWRALYPGIQKMCHFPSYFLVCAICASATIGLLFLQDEFDFNVSVFPVFAALLYFIGRTSFALYNRVTLTSNELIGLLFIGTTAVALVGQAALGLDFIDEDNKSSWDYTLAMWFYGVVYFFAGASCIHAKYPKSNAVSLIILAIVVVPLLKATDGNIFINYYNMRIALGDPGFSHLYISEWCVFLFFGSYAFAGKKLRPLITVVAIVCLFSLQGRSSTVFALATFGMYGLLSEGKKYVLFCAGIALTGVIAYFAFPIEQFLPEASEVALDRMLLSSEDGDSSLEGRSDIFSMSIAHLPQSALFGDPTFIARETHRMGSYIHNLLSVWQFFGVVPFLLMVVIIIRSLLSMLNLINRGQLTVAEEAASMLLIYSAVSVVFSKSIVFYWIWFAAGFWMMRYSNKNEEKGRSKKRRRRSKSSRGISTKRNRSLRFH